MFETKADVRYLDCDSMGVVHHSVYAVWYEIARIDFFEKCGYGYTYTHEHGVDPAVVELTMNYGMPVYFPDTVTIRTKVTMCEGKKLGLSYEVWKDGDPVPCATAKSFHIWVRNGKSCNIEEELPEMFAAYKRGMDR